MVAATTIKITIEALPLVIEAVADRRPRVVEVVGDEDATAAVLEVTRDLDLLRNENDVDPEDAVDHHPAGVHVGALVASVDPGVGRLHHA